MWEFITICLTFCWEALVWTKIHIHLSPPAVGVSKPALLSKKPPGSSISAFTGLPLHHLSSSTKIAKFKQFTVKPSSAYSFRWHWVLHQFFRYIHRSWWCWSTIADRQGAIKTNKKRQFLTTKWTAEWNRLLRSVRWHCCCPSCRPGVVFLKIARWKYCAASARQHRAEKLTQSFLFLSAKNIYRVRRHSY